ncbi:MAG: DUF3467 domain-containing protein [Candidatus Margulisiibacteriota bacterium]
MDNDPREDDDLQEDDLPEAGDETQLQQQTIHIDMDEQMAQGVYANLAISHFNQEEFVVDYVFLQPHLPKGKIRSRVIMNPRNTLRFVQMLQQNLVDYQAKFGPLSDDFQNPMVEFSIN